MKGARTSEASERGMPGAREGRPRKPTTRPIPLTHTPLAALAPLSSTRKGRALLSFPRKTTVIPAGPAPYADTGAGIQRG